MQNKDRYRPYNFIKDKYGIGRQTLIDWVDNGTIRCLRLGAGGKRLYNLSDLECKLGVKQTELHSGVDNRLTILYARVSSNKQKEALVPQRDELIRAYPKHDKVFTDIGSGVNFRRKGLSKILELVCKGMVKEIVVLFKDRLARIGYDIIEQICSMFNTKLVVHCGNTKDDDGEHDDLVSIITCFVASHHGKRGASNKKRRREEIEGSDEEKKENRRKELGDN